MTTTTTLAEQLATRYGIDRDAAQTAVDTYAGQLQDEDLYDTTTDTLTEDGEAVIRDQFAADYHGMTPTAERHDHLLDLIRRTNDEISDAQRQVDELIARRDGLIREAVAGGVRVAAIADAADMGRARVYQIRDGRR